MGIISVTPGDYTPGAATALNTVADIINAAWDSGNSKAGALEAKVDAITDELAAQTAPHVTASEATAVAVTATAVTVPDALSAGTAVAPAVAEPAVDIPASMAVSDIYTDFETEYGKLITLLSERFVSFRSSYFPDEATAYTAAEDWLQAALASDTGLPDAVAAQILEDDKARLLADASRAADNIIATFAARRFPLPTGAAAAAIVEIQGKAQDEIAASSRKVVIASIEQFRWVVEKTLGLRQMAMSSALDYIKALASGPDMASRLVGIGYDAQSKLISAASQFYNSRTAVAEMQAKVGQFNVQTALQAATQSVEVQTKVGQFNVQTALQAGTHSSDLQTKVSQFNAQAAMEAATKNQAADLSLIDNRLKALLTECQAVAQMATALYNNLHASAGTSYSVNGT